MTIKSNASSVEGEQRGREGKVKVLVKVVHLCLKRVVAVAQSRKTENAGHSWNTVLLRSICLNLWFIFNIKKVISPERH